MKYKFLPFPPSEKKYQWIT